MTDDKDIEELERKKERLEHEIEALELEAKKLKREKKVIELRAEVDSVDRSTYFEGILELCNEEIREAQKLSRALEERREADEKRPKDGPVGGIQHTVKESYPNDVGRGIVRLDPDSLLRLNLAPGDYVKIKNGHSVMVGKVWRADRRDWGQDIVRVDDELLEAVDIDPGTVVDIEEVG